MLLNETGYVKLADFGFAKKLGRDSRTRTFCGTPGNQQKISNFENAKKSFWHRLLILRFSNLAIICLKIMTRVPWITNFQNYILISPFRKFYQYYLSRVKVFFFKPVLKICPCRDSNVWSLDPYTIINHQIFRIFGAGIIGQKTTWLSSRFLVNRSFSFWTAQL